MKSLFSKLLPKLEIVLTVILFFAMLITCGLYLNVKMNGNKSPLPELPEKDKRLILRSGSDVNTNFDDDMIEPVFVGVKNDNKMIAAIPDDESRRMIESNVYSPLILLFSGSSSQTKFDTEEQRMSYIDGLKSQESYMLISFYCDMPSLAFLPCITNGTQNETNVGTFNIKSIFLLPDENYNLYAVAISSDYDINVMHPGESVPFSKITAQTYDISDGWSYFDFSDKSPLLPELTNSILLPKYQVKSVASVYGKTPDSAWVENCFDLFSVNSNLVRNFSSDDGFSVNYVDEISEISFSDDGNVEFRALDGYGINLDKYLDYVPDVGTNYGFSDKILAIKRIVNELDVYNDNISYCISDIVFDEQDSVLTVYFRFMCEGILVSDDDYHACFEITDNSLTYAMFKAVICNKVSDSVMLMPQRYASILLADSDGNIDADSVIMPVMFDESDESDCKTVKWAKISSSSEVIE